MNRSLRFRDLRLFSGKLFRSQPGTFLTQLLLTSCLLGKQVSGREQCLVFRTDSQPKLRIEQCRDRFGLQV